MPRQFVVVQRQPTELGEGAQRRWNGSRVPVAAQIQRTEPCQAAEPRRDRSAQGVVPEAQPREAGQSRQLGRNRPGQLVGGQIQVAQGGQPAQLGRDRPREGVAPRVQLLEAGQGAELRRDRAAQVVAVDHQRPEAVQVAQRGRNRAGQVVVVEKQPLEERQVAQRGRDRSAQRVAGQTQLRDPAVLGGHPEPLGERHVAQPVGAVRPAGAVRRVVQRLEGRTVRRRSGRVGDHHRGRRRLARRDSRRQRMTEGEGDRLSVVDHVVGERAEVEGGGGGGRGDGHSGGYSRVVGRGSPAAANGRQGDRQRRGRPRVEIEEAHRDRNAPALGHRVARCSEGDAPRSVAGESRRPEIGEPGQPCLQSGGVGHAYARVVDPQPLQP